MVRALRCAWRARSTWRPTPRFADEAARAANDAALAEVLERACSPSEPAQHWEDTLLAADVGCVVAHREPPETVLQSAEFAGAADMLVEVEHPTFGSTYG